MSPNFVKPHVMSPLRQGEQCNDPRLTLTRPPKKHLANEAYTVADFGEISTYITHSSAIDVNVVLIGMSFQESKPFCHCRVHTYDFVFVTVTYSGSDDSPPSTSGGASIISVWEKP